MEDQDESQSEFNVLKRAIDARFKGLESLINRQLVKDLQTMNNENKARFNAVESDQ